MAEGRESVTQYLQGHMVSSLANPETNAAGAAILGPCERFAASLLRMMSSMSAHGESLRLHAPLPCILKVLDSIWGEDQVQIEGAIF